MSGWEIWGRCVAMGVGVGVWLWPVFTAPDFPEYVSGWALAGRMWVSACGFGIIWLGLP